VAAAKKDLVNVMGRRWDTSRPNFFHAPTGLSLEDLVVKSLKKAYDDRVYKKSEYLELVRYARVRWNGREIDRKYWKEIFPEKSDRIEVLHGVRGGGGGGGKNPIATVLSVIVVAIAAALTWWAGGQGATAVIMGMSAAHFSMAVGLVAAGMLMAINMLFPAKPPKMPGLEEASSEKSSQTYSIGGGRNAHNVNGYVPLILGRHRVTPPLGAKSWTSWRGGKQYFNMLVVWGHPDITVSDFRIGETALSKFTGVDHCFHQSTTGKGLKYFGKQYNENSVGAELKQKNGWVQRTVGEANELSVDITFPAGLCTINKTDGKRKVREVELEIEYKPTSGGKWTGFNITKDVAFDASSDGRWNSNPTICWTKEEVEGGFSVFYKGGKLYAVKRGETVSGGISLHPQQSGMQEVHGCQMSYEQTSKDFEITVQPGTFKINGKVYAVGGAKAKITKEWVYDYDPEGYSSSYLKTTYFSGGKAVVLKMDSPFVVGVNTKGKLVKSAGAKQLWPTKSSGVSGGDCTFSKWNESYSSYNYNDTDEWGSPRSSTYVNTYRGIKCSVTSGTAALPAKTTAVVRGTKQEQVVRSWITSNLPLKSYDVRIRRKTKDTTDSYIIDGCEWTNMRAIIDKPVFETPIPICVSELHIQASEQLNGYVTEFNGICHSHIPDWVPAHKVKIPMAEWRGGKLVDISRTISVPGQWTVRDTSNPASIMRYLLTSKHSLIKPFPVSRLNNASFVALWKWCKSNDFRFDYVCDSEENLWSRLVSVLAPALAAPTTDVDGLWGAIYDDPNKTVRQLFTPRNSWGMQIERGFAHLPDALRVSYVDEDDDWVTKEGFIYNDGYGKEQKTDKKGKVVQKKANDVVQWEFPGVTDWKRIHKLGRYHMAQLLHRQMNVTINTDWEWLAVHRGDLVGLASDVLMNTFGTARIMRLVYRTNNRLIDESTSAYIPEDSALLVDNNTQLEYIGPGEGKPGGTARLVGIQIDDTVYYTEPKPARYGIAIRNAAGVVNTCEIKPQYGEESDTLWFVNLHTAEKIKPKCGDLVSVSLLHQWYEEYLVSSITPGDNMSAQLTLVPFKTKEIMKAANGKIPAYEAPVILDQVKGAERLPAPVLRSKGIVSDEAAATVTASGAVIVGIAAAYTIPASSENTGQFTAQLLCTSKSDGKEISGTAPVANLRVVANHAEVGETYYCKVRISDPATGRTSPWSDIVEHKVVGLVLPPPAPTGVKAVCDYPRGVVVSWDAVKVPDLKSYEVSGAVGTTVTGITARKHVHVPRYQTGSLTFHVWARDTTDHLSKTSGTASVSIDGPSTPTIRSARLENDGIVVMYGKSVIRNGVEVWESCDGTWPVVEYSFWCRNGASSKKSFATSNGESFRVVLEVPSDIDKDHYIQCRCRDYFSNASSFSEKKNVEIIPPLTPNVTVGATEDGMVAVKWTDCRTVTDIDKYVLSGAVNSATKGLSLVLNFSKDSIVWTKVDINGDSNPEGKYRKGAISEFVYAVDKWGIAGARAGGTFVIWPPYNPDLRIEVGQEGLKLSWQDCKRTFRIAKYIVVDENMLDDSGHRLTYETTATNQTLKPRPAGQYRMTVTAVDAIGVESASMMVDAYFLPGVGHDFSMAAKLEGSDVVLTWNTPDSSWPIDHYVVYNSQDLVMGKAKANFYRFPAPGAGAGAFGRYQYSVNAFDVAGNFGETEFCQIDIYRPVAPQFPSTADLPAVQIEGSGVTVRWTTGMPAEGMNTLPVAAWDVVRQWTENGVVQEQDYGRIDANTITVPAFKSCECEFMVRAVDTSGTTGAWGWVPFSVVNPGKVAISNVSTVHNNVLLFWTVPDKIYFPIDYYSFEEIETWSDGSEHGMEIGHIDALFASTFEVKAGVYKYGITPVDVAGNRGERTVVSATVEQPPAYVLYYNWPSLFSGDNNFGDRTLQTGKYSPEAGRKDFVLDGQGSMIGPFKEGETWNENILQSSIYTGETIETWQDKDDAGLRYYLSPAGGLKIARWDGALWGRLCYQDVGEDKTNFFPSKEWAWHYNGEGLESRLYALRDFPDVFKNADGEFEFLLFESDSTGPLSGNGSRYVRWKQTDNPATTYYGNVSGATGSDAVEGFDLVSMVGTSFSFGGLALSSAGNALMDGNPKHSNWNGAVATTTVYQNGLPVIGGSSRYGQLWVRLPDNDSSKYGCAELVEVIDVGEEIPSTTIRVAIDSRTLAGDPSFSCKIETSLDGTAWTVLSENSLSIAATNFRYVRYTVGVTGGVVAVASINYRLEIIEMNDSGSCTIQKEDVLDEHGDVLIYANGDAEHEWTSMQDTPMLTGQWISFNKSFMDITSLARPNVIAVYDGNDEPQFGADAIVGYTAYTVFEDLPHPEGFRCFVLDANGNRAKAIVHWEVFGV
jgi:predicted phage tail protein